MVGHVAGEDLREAVSSSPKQRESVLVFSRSGSNNLLSVKLFSGSLSHENPGNQFGHAAPIFMIILLAVTAVMQIICLNRGLQIYDSTLVVPVFYGVYTASGCVLLSPCQLFADDHVQILRLSGKRLTQPRSKLVLTLHRYLTTM